MMARRKYNYTKYKQGQYQPVNKEKYTGKHTPEYRSSWELKFFKWCDKNPNVLKWSSESTIIPYVSPLDNKIHRYFVDGNVTIKEGNNIKNYLIEIKPEKQTKPPIESKRKKKTTILYEKMQYAVNQAKWSAAKQYATKKNLDFLILTEKELFI